MSVRKSILSCQRRLFSLDEGTHYLNCAYMSPLLKSVEAAGILGMQRKRDPSHITSSDFYTESDELRKRFAQLVNVSEPERIAIIPSASYGIATAAQNIAVRPAQHVVVAHEQFPSNIYPWQALQNKGVSIKTVMPPEQTKGRAKIWNQRILEAIDRDTAAVALANVHWANGTRFDLECIGQRAREVEAAFVIDGTQSVGAMPFDIQKIQPDALICAGYKWLLCPYSTGLAYFGPRFDDGQPIEQNWMTRFGSEDFSRLVNYQDKFQPNAIRYDVGERCNFILVPMMIAAIEQLLSWGVEHIQSYCRQLTQPFVEAVRALGYWVEEDAWRGAHLFGIGTPPQLDRQALLQKLSDEQISVSVRGDSVRVSAHLFNDESDIEALLEVLKGAITNSS